MQYPDMFKNAMIQKMTGPGAISASALSKHVDVPHGWMDLSSGTIHSICTVRFVTLHRTIGILVVKITSYPIEKRCMKKPEVEIRTDGHATYVIGTRCIWFG